MCGYEYSGLAKILNVAESGGSFRLPRRSMQVLRETEVSLAFDGGNNVGMLALFHAAQATIKDCGPWHCARFGDRRLDERTQRLLCRDDRQTPASLRCIPLSSSQQVAPPGGMRPVLGTNPIAIAVPSSRGPIVLDMGTSAYMMTEVMLRERLGKSLPEGVALGPAGEPTRDPAAGTTRRLAAVRRLQGFRACAHGAGAGAARRFRLGRRGRIRLSARCLPARSPWASGRIRAAGDAADRAHQGDATATRCR